MDLSLTALLHVVLKLVGVAIVGALLYWLVDFVQRKLGSEATAKIASVVQILIIVVLVIIVIFIVLAMFGIR